VMAAGFSVFRNPVRFRAMPVLPMPA